MVQPRRGHDINTYISDLEFSFQRLDLRKGVLHKPLLYLSYYFKKIARNTTIV